MSSADIVRNTDCIGGDSIVVQSTRWGPRTLAIVLPEPCRMSRVSGLAIDDEGFAAD
jgi:hypothetical protein